MKNAVALSIVTLFLAACSAHVWTHTHARQTLVPAMPSTQWDDYVQRGGAFAPAR